MGIPCLPNAATTSDNDPWWYVISLLVFCRPLPWRTGPMTTATTGRKDSGFRLDEVLIIGERGDWRPSRAKLHRLFAFSITSINGASGGCESWRMVVPKTGLPFFAYYGKILPGIFKRRYNVLVIGCNLETAVYFGFQKHSMPKAWFTLAKLKPKMP